MKKLKHFLKEHQQSLRFIGLFVVFLIILFGGYLLLKDFLGFLNVATAASTAFVLKLLGVSLTQTGVNIALPGMTLTIIYECTGIFALFIYLSCVLAFPTTIQKKMYGILLGIPSIYLLNLARMVVLSYVGIYFPKAFDFVHSYLWQTTFIIVVVLIWLLWIEFIVSKKKSKKAKESRLRKK